MGITIGGIDPVQSIIDLEVRVLTLERLLELSVNKSPINDKIFQEIRIWALNQVKNKYPQLGLEVKDGAA